MKLILFFTERLNILMLIFLNNLFFNYPFFPFQWDGKNYCYLKKDGGNSLVNRNLKEKKFFYF